VTTALRCGKCGSPVHIRKRPLTDKQRTVLNSIRAHISDNGSAPTLQTLADMYGNALSSMWAVVDHLEKKGHIRKTPRDWQAMEVIE